MNNDIKLKKEELEIKRQKLKLSFFSEKMNYAQKLSFTPLAVLIVLILTDNKLNDWNQGLISVCIVVFMLFSLFDLRKLANLELELDEKILGIKPSIRKKYQIMRDVMLVLIVIGFLINSILYFILF